MAGRWKIALGLALAVGVSPESSRAAEWYLESSLQEQLLFDDNSTLAVEQKIPAASGITSTEVKLGRRTEILTLGLEAKIDFKSFVEGPEPDSVDHRFHFISAYETERGHFGLDAEIINDITFGGAEENAGSFTKGVRVTTLSVSPIWAYEMTPLDRLNLSGGTVSREYDSPDLVNYQSYSGSVGWQHYFSERLAGTASASVSQFEPQGADSISTTTLSFQPGIVYDWTQRLRLELAGGTEATFSDSNAPDNGVQLGYRINSRAIYAWDELTKIEANYTHMAESTGTGTTTARDRIGISMEYQWNEMTTARFQGSYVGSLLGGGGDTVGSALSAEPSLIWHVFDDLDLSFSYRFRQQTSQGDTPTAYSNAFFVTLAHRLPRLSWSE
jgi:hypothetical protein